MGKQFYKTVITYTVLSEHPITNESLRDLLEECDTGGDVGFEESRESTQLSEAEMSAELIRVGSDPGFFSMEDLPSGKFMARFNPQVWLNDYAINVDPLGGVEFDVTPEVEAILAAGGEVPKSNSLESDELRTALRAPRWIRDWTGPFWIEVRALEDRSTCSECGNDIPDEHLSEVNTFHSRSCSLHTENVVSA